MAYGNIIACICEGNAESVIINKLMDEGKLIFSRDDLLDNEVLRCRKASEFEHKYLRKAFDKKIIVYRILDSRKEVFKLHKEYIHKVDVINVITAPEIEMLIIINEGKYVEYSRVKNNIKPSVFCKDVLKLKSVKTKKFVINYFSNVDDLVEAVREYKRLSCVQKNEICLADLLV